VALFRLTLKGGLTISSLAPAQGSTGRFYFRSAFARILGEVPEWLKGTDCKSVGFAYAGSNPALSTIPPLDDGTEFQPPAPLAKMMHVVVA
jgi:hypothetical protein